MIDEMMKANVERRRENTEEMLRRMEAAILKETILLRVNIRIISKKERGLMLRCGLQQQQEIWVLCSGTAKERKVEKWRRLYLRAEDLCARLVLHFTYFVRM